MKRRALAINCGSSSLKIALMEDEDTTERVVLRRSLDDVDDIPQAIAGVVADLDARDLRPDVVGHRMVHGGPSLVQPTRIDAAVLSALERVIPFAPIHLPPEIAAIRAIAQQWPGIVQVACFDTAFHASMPEIAERLPIPAEWHARGIRRYGFHGLSYEHVVAALGKELGARTVIAHLGSGASMVAVRDGKAIDTTMGFTPAGGLVMGTRSGDLDPGLLLYLLRDGVGVGQLDRMLEHESGLLALSEKTADMRKLLDLRDSDPRAEFAIEAFCASASKWLGALTAALGGIDMLVFTGGIGENAPAIRLGIVRKLAYLGIALDETANERNDEGKIGVGACDVRIVRADEERIVARHALIESAR